VEAQGALPLGGLYFADTIAPGFDDTRSVNLGGDLRTSAPHFARDRRDGGYFADTFAVTSRTGGDFLFVKSFIISDTSQSTLPMALLVFFKPDENDWGGIMAASTVMTVPVLVFFVLVQRRLVSGLGGAVKD